MGEIEEPSLDLDLDLDAERRHRTGTTSQRWSLPSRDLGT